MKDLHDLLKIMCFIANNNPTVDEVMDFMQNDLKKVVEFIRLLLDANQLRLINNHLYLTKSAEEYLINDLYKLVDPFNTVSCVGNDENKCLIYDECNAICFWDGLNKVFNDYINLYTLEDLMKGYCII